MEKNATETIRVDYKKLTNFITACFEALGVPSNDAEIAANVLVLSDLRGVDTHGVIRFRPDSWYVKWLKEGSMNARPNVRIVSENAATALIDGDNGMGMVVGHRAMEIAIQKAQSFGAAIPDSVTPECFYRGSRSGFAWIPAKACGNDGLREDSEGRLRSKLRGIDPVR